MSVKPLVLCEGLKMREQFELGVSVFQELLKFSAKYQGDGKGRDMQMGLLEGTKRWIWTQKHDYEILGSRP